MWCFARLALLVDKYAMPFVVTIVQCVFVRAVAILQCRVPRPGYMLLGKTIIEQGEHVNSQIHISDMMQHATCLSDDTLARTFSRLSN